MKTLISLTLLMLFAILASVASAQDANSVQSISQNASNSAKLIGNASVNQSIVQNASQNAQIIGNASLNQSTSQMANQTAAVQANQSAPQGASQAISQNANQAAQSTGNASAGQSITQNAYQNVTWNVQNYWVNNQTTSVTTEQKSILEVRTNQVLTDYSSMRMYIMPFTDFRTVYTERAAQVFILDVSSGSVATKSNIFPGAVWIPLESLASRLNEIPPTATIIVVSDNDIDSAVAMTMLRIYGYNAWIVPSGNCSWEQSGGWMQQSASTTGYAGGVSSTSQYASSTTTSASSYTTPGYTALGYSTPGY